MRSLPGVLARRSPSIASRFAANGRQSSRSATPAHSASISSIRSEQFSARAAARSRAAGPDVACSTPASCTVSLNAREISLPWSVCTSRMGKGKAPDAVARAIAQRRVLEEPPPPDPHELHVHLDGVPPAVRAQRA
jgi:hypothetical protein